MRGKTAIGLHVWTPADEGELTPSVINYIVRSVGEGNHDPAQVRRVLKHFLACTEHGIPNRNAIPAALIEFLRTAFADYLRRPQPGRLERALGLVRGKKRPVIREDRHHQIAWAVLREKLRDKTLKAAALIVGPRFGLEPKTVEGIWAKHKYQAFDLERIGRAMESKDSKANWTNAEEMRLRYIYGAHII